MIATSESINEIATALSKAQATIKNPSMNRVNKGYNSKYADLAEILNVARPALSAQGIAILQITKLVDDGVVLHTRLVHTTGQWIESTYPVFALDTHQKMGAGLTYAKRQALSSLIGIAGEDDLDGEDTKDDSVKKKAAPSLSPKDSEANFHVFMDDLEDMDLSSLKDLNEWATRNGPDITRLLPEHSKKIREKFSQLKEAAQNVPSANNAKAGS